VEAFLREARSSYIVAIRHTSLIWTTYTGKFLVQKIGVTRHQLNFSAFSAQKTGC
jgi:hypothetical protein